MLYLGREWFKGSTSRSNWNLEVLVFVEGRKPENPEKTPSGSKVKKDNKLNPLETASTGIEPGSQRWEASATLSMLPKQHIFERTKLLTLPN